MSEAIIHSLWNRVDFSLKHVQAFKVYFDYLSIKTTIKETNLFPHFVSQAINYIFEGIKLFCPF